MKTKNIGYAYPSSIIANSKGFAKTGCWYLSIQNDDEYFFTGQVVYSSLEKQDVLMDAENYAEPWGFYSMHEEQSK